MRDLAASIQVGAALGLAVLAASASTARLDLVNKQSGQLTFQSKALAVAVGVGGITFDPTNRIDFVLTHSDDDVTYTPVLDADVRITNPDFSKGAVAPGGVVYTVTAAHAAATVSKVGYTGDKRYQKLQAVFGGTHGTGTPITVSEITGHPVMAPVV